MLGSRLFGQRSSRSSIHSGREHRKIGETSQKSATHRHDSKKLPDKDKVILLTTAGGEDWKPKSVEVDAITSASKAPKAAPLAEEIVGKVRKILDL